MRPIVPFIDEMTSTVLVTGSHVIETKHNGIPRSAFYNTSGGFYAISPYEETKIYLTLINNKNFPLNFRLKDRITEEIYYSDIDDVTFPKATVEQGSDNKSAIITILDPNRDVSLGTMDVFNMILEIYHVDGREMKHYEGLPRIETRYFDNSLSSLSVSSSSGSGSFTPAFSSSVNEYAVSFDEYAESVTVSASISSGDAIKNIFCGLGTEGRVNRDADTRIIPDGSASGTTSSINIAASKTIYINVQADSGEIKTYTLRIGSVPSAPQNLTAVFGNEHVVLNWAAPANNGGFAVAKYQYSYGATAGYTDSWQDIPNSSASTAAYIVTGLDNGTNYTFKIRAVNEAGAGTPASITATPCTVPSAPANFAVVPGNQTAVLTWSELTGDATGGSAILRYEVSSDNGSTWATADSSTGHTFTSLANNTTYTFRVRAVNAAGNGTAAGPITATPSVQDDVNLTISFAELEKAPTISVTPLSRAAKHTLSVTADTGFTNYAWYINGSATPILSGNEATARTLTLTAAQLEVYGNGNHFLTLIVRTSSGGLYNATINFTVTN